MFKKKKKEKTENKRQSAIITKESFCATFGVLSFLALLMLFTGSFVFGVAGNKVQEFFIGAFGYMAYPLLLCFTYACVTGLFGVRFVKNRKAGAFFIVSLILLALILHIAVTYSWAEQGYLKRCYNSGKNFPKTAPFGWVGGAISLAFFSLFTKVGALVMFSVVALLCCYLCYVELRKGKTTSAEEAIAPPAAEVAYTEDKRAYNEGGQVLPPQTIGESPAYQGETSYYPPTAPPQMPGVSLGENGGGFSPFSGDTGGYTPPLPKLNARDVLFGGSPTDNYTKNLAFDPNSQANNRQISAPQPQTTFVPSYSSMYEQEMNEKEEEIRPVKIVTDRSREEYDYGRTEPTPPPPAETYVSLIQEETAQPPTFERVETPKAPSGEGTSYERHEYMNLFSTENPNVFGNDEESSRFGRDFVDRKLGRDSQEETEPPRREGINLLDDEEEDAYPMRGQTSDVTPVKESDAVEPTDEGSRGFTRGYEREQAEVAPRVPQAEEPKKPRVIRPYVQARLDDFDCRDIQPLANTEEVEQVKETIIATLEEFKITGIAISSVTFGPTVTRYNVTIPRNVSPKKVVALDQPIALALMAAKGVNIYPNYEDGVVSIEVPNKTRQFVKLGCMLTGDTFVNAKPSALMFAMGKDVANRKVYGDISKMIHMLVAGSSGSGKSEFLKSLIISMIYKYSPEELRLILIDPKKTEFVLYNNLPHLMVNEIITEPNKAVQSLNWAIGEMNRRYSLFEQMSRSGQYVVNLDQYNEHMEKGSRLPKIVIIIDELADLMLAAKKEMEDRIQNLTQKARAAGIHLIVATQRPSTDVITGVIKSNLATRMAFGVASDVDSRVILDQTGAQKLLGKGDFLYTMPGVNVPVRVQSAYLMPEEAQRIVDFIKNNNEAYYDEEATAFINSRGGNGGDYDGGNGDGGVDPMFIEALRYVVQSNSASISMIQRKCSAGYNRAGKIIEWMEDMGYISPFDGAKARKVLITKEEFESKYGPL